MGLEGGRLNACMRCVVKVSPCYVYEYKFLIIGCAICCSPRTFS